MYQSITALPTDTGVIVTSHEGLLADAGIGITFAFNNAQLNLEQDHKDASRSIAMQLVLDGRNDVLLPTYRSLRTSSWSIYLVEVADASLANAQDQAIGMLSYYEESSDSDYPTPEQAHMRVMLTQGLFATLLSALCSGLPPDHIIVTVRGLEFGAAPDGSDVVWDIASSPRVPITNVAFLTVVCPRPKSNERT